jgi:hypothetical protein
MKALKDKKNYWRYFKPLTKKMSNKAIRALVEEFKKESRPWTEGQDYIIKHYGKRSCICIRKANEFRRKADRNIITKLDFIDLVNASLPFKREGISIFKSMSMRF